MTTAKEKRKKINSLHLRRNIHRLLLWMAERQLRHKENIYNKERMTPPTWWNEYDDGPMIRWNGRVRCALKAYDKAWVHYYMLRDTQLRDSSLLERTRKW